MRSGGQAACPRGVAHGCLQSCSSREPHPECTLHSRLPGLAGSLVLAPLDARLLVAAADLRECATASFSAGSDWQRAQSVQLARAGSAPAQCWLHWMLLMSMPSCTISQRGDISRSCRQAGRQAEGNRGRRAGGHRRVGGRVRRVQRRSGRCSGSSCRGGGRGPASQHGQAPAPSTTQAHPGTHPPTLFACCTISCCLGHHATRPNHPLLPPALPTDPGTPRHPPTHLVHVLHSQLHCAVHLTLCREAPHTEANAGVCLQGRCEPGQGRTGQGRG